MKNINSRIVSEFNLPEEGTYDVLLIQFPDGFPNSKLTFNFALFDGELEGFTRKVTGLQKVVQKFLYCLFSSKGTDAMYPERGTELPDLLRGGNLHSQGYVESMISEAVRDASTQVASQTSFETDLSSKLDSVTINEVQIGITSVAIALTIHTAAGVDAPIYVPFPKFNLEIN